MKKVTEKKPDLIMVFSFCFEVVGRIEENEKRRTSRIIQTKRCYLLHLEISPKYVILIEYILPSSKTHFLEIPQ